MKYERKPEIKYSDCYKALYITDSAEENDSSSDELTTPEYSSDNPESSEKKKRERVKG